MFIHGRPLQPSLMFLVKLKSLLSCKIFEHFALQVDPVIEYNPDPLHSKTAPFWCQNWLIPLSGGKATPPPLNLDPVYLIRIDSYFVLFKDVCSMKYSYLETRSHRVNMSFIILWLPLFGVDCDQAWSLEGCSLTHKHLAWVERPHGWQHFSVFGPFIEYDFKKF